MPEMTMLGWFHTILGIGAVLTGFYAIAKFKIISLENKIGQIYVVLTAIVAGSALGYLQPRWIWSSSYLGCLNFDSFGWRYCHGKI
jgi:hypothetical protein